MKTDFINYNMDDYLAKKGACLPICPQKPHLPVLLLLENTGSMEQHILKVEECVNKFREYNFEDGFLGVDICVIGFDHKVHILQDWRPIEMMENVKLSCCAGTNMSEALDLAVVKLKERTCLYREMGIDCILPILFIVAEGYCNNIDEIAAVIRQRTEENKLRSCFFGVPGYGESTAIQIAEERVFELANFWEFIHFMSHNYCNCCRGERPLIGKKVEFGVKLHYTDWLK